MTRTALVLLLLAPASALASPKGRPKHKHQAEPASHFELAVGFLGGTRSYGSTPFALTSDSEGLAGLDEPFVVVPFEDSAVIGPRWESRIVLEGVRMTLAYQRPYPTWDGLAPTQVTGLDGQPLSASARGLRANELRFGLGMDLVTTDIGVTPFVDLIGDIAWVQTDLAVGGAAATYRSESFSMGPRAGVRIDLAQHLFLELSGEYGLVGPTGWGGQLMVGAAMF